MINYEQLYIAVAGSPPHSTSGSRSAPRTTTLGRPCRPGGSRRRRAAVAAARKAFDKGPWPTMRPEERRALVARFDELHAAAPVRSPH